MNVGDQVVVTTPFSTYYGLRGKIRRIDLRRGPLGYFCVFDQFPWTTDKPTPFMGDEITVVEPPAESGGSPTSSEMEEAANQETWWEDVEFDSLKPS